MRFCRKHCEMKGISHKEAAVLLECELEEENKELKNLQKRLKSGFMASEL